MKCVSYHVKWFVGTHFFLKMIRSVTRRYKFVWVLGWEKVTLLKRYFKWYYNLPVVNLYIWTKLWASQSFEIWTVHKQYRFYLDQDLGCVKKAIKKTYNIGNRILSKKWVYICVKRFVLLSCVPFPDDLYSCTLIYTIFEYTE